MRKLGSRNATMRKSGSCPGGAEHCIGLQSVVRDHGKARLSECLTGLAPWDFVGQQAAVSGGVGMASSLKSLTLILSLYLSITLRWLTSKTQLVGVNETPLFKWG
jgi:hypothetical protein